MLDNSFPNFSKCMMVLFIIDKTMIRWLWARKLSTRGRLWTSSWLNKQLEILHKIYESISNNMSFKQKLKNKPWLCIETNLFFHSFLKFFHISFIPEPQIRDYEVSLQTIQYIILTATSTFYPTFIYTVNELKTTE